MMWIWNVLVFAAAWVGHAFWLTVLLNVVYARPLHRKILRTDRMIIALIVFAFPAVVLWITRGSLIDHIIHQPDPTGVYLAYCLFVGLGVLPIATIRKSFRRIPSQLLSQSHRIVDIAAELGFRPLGFGEHWRMARSPRNQIFEVEFNEKTLALQRLPAALDGLTILHIGDLHFHGTPEREFFQRVIDEINRHEPPDLVCMTGDVVDTLYHHRWIKPLLGQLSAREAKMAILGNHDYWCEPQEVRKQLRRAGFIVLGQEPIALTIRNAQLTVLAHEGPWFPAPLSKTWVPGAEALRRPSNGDASQTGASKTPPQPPELTDQPLEQDHFRLLLSHTPDNIEWARKQNVDLMLSGHTHGGQWRFPLIGSIFVPSRYSRKYDCGVFYEPPTLLHVTRGISGREPLRWNCRPEVTWLILRATR
jgi:uncharacterized protein